jgi:hypothetical protein
MMRPRLSVLCLAPVLALGAGAGAGALGSLMAGDDFNAATIPDRDWEPLLPTPPVQDHPSTHSALGAAAAAVLAGLLGDATQFAMTSTSALRENPARRFASFSLAARENAESRVLAGLHFRFACEAGLDLGQRIGALAHHLRPLE